VRSSSLLVFDQLSKASAEMFGCCCQESSDKSSQVLYPMVNDAVMAETTSHGQTVSQTVVSSAPAPAMLVPTQTAAAAQDHSARTEQTSEASIPTLTPEEKQREKDRLQELVKSFAKRALQGIPCTFVDSSTGQCHDTVYKVGKKLETLIISPPSGTSIPEIACSIATIDEIYGYKEGGGEVEFPPAVISALSSEQSQRALMVCHASGSFCFLESSTDSRESFLTCMRILRLYCVGQPSPPAA